MVASVDRDRIAEAIHRAVCEESNSDGQGRCALYALAGRLVLTQLTATPYIFQAGGFAASISDTSPRVMIMDPQSDHYRCNEFHCWIARWPQGAKPGDCHKVSPDDEFVDFSLRHIPAYTKRVRPGTQPMEWERADWPLYFWGSLQDLALLRIQFRVDAQMMNLIFEDKPLLNAAARVAKRVLNNGAK
jgi:hypothetical protein